MCDFHTFHILWEFIRKDVIAFLANMNMSKFVSSNNELRKSIPSAVSDVARESMNETAMELQSREETVLDTAVSCDGMWKRRCFVSKNSIATFMGREQ